MLRFQTDFKKLTSKIKYNLNDFFEIVIIITIFMMFINVVFHRVSKLNLDEQWLVILFASSNVISDDMMGSNLKT